MGTCVALLDPGVREHFFAFLARDYSTLVEGYGRLYSGARANRKYEEEIRAMVQVLAERTGAVRVPRLS